MLKRFFDRIKFTELFAILAAGILAFGLQIPFLGLFQDDWHFVHYGSARGAQGMLEFLTMDGRPTAAWVYIVGYALIGFAPVRWHILSLILRLLTTILLWLVLKTIWPKRTRGNLIATLFFLLYPFFVLQPQAVTYAEHWTSFAFFSLSILLMLKSIEQPKHYLTYTALAVLSTALHLFTVEYFVGLELLRPFMAWMMLSKTEADRKNMLRRVLLIWIPYLLILILFLAWRGAVLSNFGLRNNPLDLFSAQAILTIFQNIWADFALVLVSAWFNLIQPNALELDTLRNLLVLGITLVAGLAAFFHAKRFSENDSQENGTRQVLLAGTLAFLLGLAPAYAVGYIIHLKLAPWHGRFALAALPGAALILSVVFEALFTSARVRRVMFAVLVGLLIGWQNRSTFDFKTSWEKQVKLYEQLTWRAPSIEAGTAIITDQEILSYMGDYPTSFALNTIYDTTALRPSPYWFFAMSENLGTDADSLASGVELKAQKYASTFVGDSRNSLIIVFEPEKNQCLWILRPEDAAYRGFLPQIKTAAQVSNLSRIHDQPQSDFALFRTIIPEDRGTWCFHYERADLARQINDWEQVIFMWDLAQRGGYSPAHGFEYIPFIQAYAQTGDWEMAFALTKQSNRVSANMKSILCLVWEKIIVKTSTSAERDSAFSAANNLLGCQ
jgi:hypothetical protein